MDESSDTADDAERSKRAIAILLDVSESLEEEIRASTPKKDEPTTTSVSSENRARTDNEGGNQATKEKTAFIDKELGGSDAGNIPKNNSCDELNNVSSTRESDLSKVREKICNKHLQETTISGLNDLSKDNNDCLTQVKDKDGAVTSEVNVNNPEAVAIVELNNVITEEGTAGDGLLEIKDSKNSCVQLETPILSDKEILHLETSLNTNSNIDDTGVDKVNGKKMVETNIKKSKSLTDILSEDIINDIDELLELNISATGDEIEKHNKEHVITKQLVVLLPKMCIDNTILNKTDCNNTSAVVCKKDTTVQDEFLIQKIVEVKTENLLTDKAIKNVAQHENDIKKANNTSSKAPRCYCEVCSMLFVDPRKYWNHRYLNHENHEFSCPLCERNFKKVSSLIHHTKFKHAEVFNNTVGHSDEQQAMFFCESCGKGFSDVYSRLLHIQNFHQDKYILCNGCQLSFSNIDDLIFHAKIHQIYKNTNYTCQICNKTIFFLSNFLTHLKHHNLNTKIQFKCKICKYNTNKLKLYKAHLLAHKKFSCTLCLKQFSSRKMLLLHKTKYFHRNSKIKKKQVLDRFYSFSSHVKGRRRFTVRSSKKKNQTQIFTFSKVIPKSLPNPHQIVVTKAAKLQEIKRLKKKFKTLMAKLAVPERSKRNKILYIKLIKINKLRQTKPPRRNLKNNAEPTLSFSENITKEIIHPTESSDSFNVSEVSREEIPFKATESNNTFKIPGSPAPKVIRKKLSESSKPTTKKLDTTSTTKTKDKSTLNFEPGKTATDAQGLQKSTELSSYKIPKKDGRSAHNTSIITGDAKHITAAKVTEHFKSNATESKHSKGSKIKKSRFEPLPVNVQTKEKNLKTMAKVSESNSAKKQVVNAPPILLKKNKNESHSASSKPKKNSPTEEDCNQSDHVLEQYGNNMAWETAAKNLMAQSLGAPLNENQIFAPSFEGIPSFGGQALPPYQGPQHQASPFGPGPQPVNPPFGTQGPPFGQPGPPFYQQQFGPPFGLQGPHPQGPPFIPQNPQQQGSLFGSGGPQPHGPPFCSGGLQQQGPSFGPGFGSFGPIRFSPEGQHLTGSQQPFRAPSYLDPLQPSSSKILERTENICSGCKKDFPSTKVLDLHLIFCNKLPALKETICPVCSKTFDKRTVLKQHMFILHSKLFSKFNLILGTDLVEKYKCKSCPQVFENKEDKDAHEQTHIFLDAFNAIKAKQEKSVTISAPPQLYKPNSNASNPAPLAATKKCQSSTMSKEQLEESAKKALTRIQSPAFKKILEMQKNAKPLKINLQYLKGKQGPSVTSAPEKKIEITPLPFSAPKSVSLTKDIQNKSKTSRQWEFFPAIRESATLERKISPEKNTGGSRSRRRSHSRSRSVSPPVERTGYRKTRSISPKNKPSKTHYRRRSRSRSPRDKGRSNRRSRSHERGKGRRRSRSTSRDERSHSPYRRERNRSEERSQSPPRPRPKPKLNPEDAAYRCSKCAMLFTNFRDFSNHKESHEGSDDEESYLSLLDYASSSPSTSSASAYPDAYTCVVCLQTFNNLQQKDDHTCSGPF